MMIYLDSSVALAELLSEDRRGPPDLWDQDLTSSRLLQYEIWNRLHTRGLGKSHAAEATALLQKIAFLDLTPDVLRRALRPFPVSVRTLDGLHLATAEYLTGEGESIELATHDVRMIAAARALGIAIYEP
jgi:predicted nucleic acid-binding protein